MSPDRAWTRRTFLSTLSLTGAAAVAPRIAALDLHERGAVPASAPFLAFVGFSGVESGDRQRIESYRVENGTWTAINAPLSAESPRALALHPRLAVLYVAHATALHRYLPRGSVSSYVVDPATCELSLLSEEPLSLSATYPTHLAVSPDGRRLLVSTGGGSYNFFSLEQDGAILPNPHPLKQTGSGPHPLQRSARPHSALFQSTGLAAYATDLGADRLNQIVFGEAGPRVESRISFTPGSGPAHLALHPSGELLLVANRLRPGLSVVPVDAASGELRGPIEDYPLDADLAGPIALSRSGRLVYVAGFRRGQTRVSVLALARSTGKLRCVQQSPVCDIAQPEELVRCHDQMLLVGAGGIVRLPLEQHSGLLGEPMLALRSRGAVSLAVRTV